MHYFCLMAQLDRHGGPREYLGTAKLRQIRNCIGTNTACSLTWPVAYKFIGTKESFTIHIGNTFNFHWTGLEHKKHAGRDVM